uniref:Uncharacterized protein n=1 Tax=Arundo donax TaxID=35708 RepID=A0A0A9FKR6_ARUDO
MRRLKDYIPTLLVYNSNASLKPSSN